jgi:hypothetical protein
MACHLIWSQEETNLHLIFFNLKFKWKTSNDVSFFKILIGKNTLCSMTKKMTTNLDMDSKQIINKIGRVTIGISHMEDVFILVEYGMAIIGHYDVNFKQNIISQQGY